MRLTYLHYSLRTLRILPPWDTSLSPEKACVRESALTLHDGGDRQSGRRGRGQRQLLCQWWGRTPEGRLADWVGLWHGRIVCQGRV